MRFVLLLIALGLLSSAAAAKPANVPAANDAFTNALLDRAALDAARSRFDEALLEYELGVKDAPSEESKVLIRYEHARLLIGLQRIPEAFAVIDELVASPALPSLACESGAPSVWPLLRDAAYYNREKVAARAEQHEREGRLAEAWVEASVANHAEVRARLASRFVRVDVASDAEHFTDAVTTVDGRAVGSRTQTTCWFEAEPARTVVVHGKTGDGREADRSVALRSGLAPVHVVLFEPLPPHEPPPAPLVPPAEPRTGAALLYANVGLGGGGLRAEGPTEISTSGSGHLAAMWILLLERKHLSYAWLADGSIGGGSDGLQVQGRFHMEVGPRLPLYDTERTTMGLFVRAGLGVRALANNTVQTGTIDVPTLSAGASYYRGPIGIQVGGRVAPTLFGRYSSGDAFNRLDARRRFEVAPSYGPFASIHLGPVHVDGEYVRVDSSQAPGTPVDYVQGSVCGTMVFVGLCGHTMYATSDVTADPTTGPWSRARALYVGGSLVLAIDSTGFPVTFPSLLKRH